MVDLVAENASGVALPLEFGDCRLSAVMPEYMTLISPYKGQEKQVSEALKMAHGVGFPAPNRALGKEGARCIWFGPVQAMLIGVAPDKSITKFAAVVDQSDGWVVMRLEGEAAAEVLARLMPLDLRASVFKRGATARSQLKHMPVSITRVGKEAFDIMAFGSMAKTLTHDLRGAMVSVAAQ